MCFEKFHAASLEDFLGYWQWLKSLCTSSEKKLLKYSFDALRCLNTLQEWVAFSVWILDWQMSDIVLQARGLVWNIFPISNIPGLEHQGHGGSHIIRVHKCKPQPEEPSRIIGVTPAHLLRVTVHFPSLRPLHLARQAVKWFLSMKPWNKEVHSAVW